MTLLASFAGGCLGARAFCFVSPALRHAPAGSSFTYAERSGTKALGLRGMCAGGYQNESEMKKFGMLGIAVGMKALEGMLK